MYDLKLSDEITCLVEDHSAISAAFTSCHARVVEKLLEEAIDKLENLALGTLTTEEYEAFVSWNSLDENVDKDVWDFFETKKTGE